MKLLHVGDLHLGRSLGEFDLTEDQEYMLDRLLDIVKERSVDAVLIAGDVYDRSIPSEAATRMLDRFLSELAKEDVSVFMISGNHDSDERLNYGSSLFAANHIFISTKYKGGLCKQTFKTDGTEADIYLLPFVKASQVRHYLPEEKIETYDDAVRAVIKHADIDRSRINVLIAHQFVTDKSRDPGLSGSESIATQSVGLVEKIDYDCFDDFDYVALGHIHSPQHVGRKEVRYSGSPLKYSLSEVNNEKSAVLVTLNSKGDTGIELVPIKPRRNMRHLKDKLKNILDKDRVTDTEDYIYVTLTDEEIISDAMGIIQQVYKNTVKIDYDNSHTREVEQIDISKIAENRSFDELISDFYRQVYGCEISEEEMDVMKDVAREAGVLHEAG
ncbi:MAG: exonuclease SbcCD subunit D [Lachnospiraceae bacterium]|nr:exonuclease SbcCD subunit D [Lachnospiraceae bacterium]